ncbi:dermatopontin-like [Physella acuta]|uniref:dermatopontin-like n=1 Tax=Physella acuta TaxID=109671 RepID=UPI0027DB3A9D|nr:dermatopontin-like [Physella acuta]
MGIFTYLALTVSMATMYAGGAFTNDWDKPFDYRCPLSQTISYIYSEHNNFFEDRKWEFYCRSVGETADCEQSGYVNQFDQLLHYVCPRDKFITGIASYHDNHYEDRRFQFQCCRATGRNLTGCFMTGDANTWDQKLTFMVPVGMVINGAYSTHNNYYEDRIWRFQICYV